MNIDEVSISMSVQDCRALTEFLDIMVDGYEVCAVEDPLRAKKCWERSMLASYFSPHTGITDMRMFVQDLKKLCVPGYGTQVAVLPWFKTTMVHLTGRTLVILQCMLVLEGELRESCPGREKRAP